MCIRELIEQFEIQGRFCIKTWDDEACDCIVLVKGHDFECDRYDISDDIMESKITYMYALGDVLNIEIE